MLFKIVKLEAGDFPDPDLILFNRWRGIPRDKGRRFRCNDNVIARRWEARLSIGGAQRLIAYAPYGPRTTAEDAAEAGAWVARFADMAAVHFRGDLADTELNFSLAQARKDLAELPNMTHLLVLIGNSLTDAGVPLEKPDQWGERPWSEKQRQRFAANVQHHAALVVGELTNERDKMAVQMFSDASAQYHKLLVDIHNRIRVRQNQYESTEPKN